MTVADFIAISGRIMLRSLLAPVALLILAGTAVAQDAVNPPTIKPGDRWNYLNGDIKRSLRVDSVEADGTIVATVTTPSLGGVEARFTRDWNPLMAPVPMLGNVRFQRYSPPVCLMPPAPWTVGKEWACDAGWSDGTYSGTTHVKGKIAAAEKITVPAGTFDTLRLAFNVGGTDATCWYAPQVEYYARCRSAVPDYNYDLVSYELK
jgi:hypothetical protein